MPEFLPKPMKLNEIVESNSKYLQVCAVVWSATPKSVYNEKTGKAKQELRIIDDTGTSMLLLLLEMQYTDSFLAGDVVAIRYSDKATINNEPGLTAFASHVATGIGSAVRPVKTSSWSGTPKLTTMRSRRRMPKRNEEEYATDLAAYKLTIQDKNPDEFKELVLETYTAHSQASVQQLNRSERKHCSWSPPQEEQLQDSKVKTIAKLVNAHLEHTQDRKNHVNILSLDL